MKKIIVRYIDSISLEIDMQQISECSSYGLCNMDLKLPVTEMSKHASGLLDPVDSLALDGVSNLNITVYCLETLLLGNML